MPAAAGFQNIELRSPPAAEPANEAPCEEVDCSRTAKPPACTATALMASAPAATALRTRAWREIPTPLMIDPPGHYNLVTDCSCRSERRVDAMVRCSNRGHPWRESDGHVSSQ